METPRFLDRAAGAFKAFEFGPTGPPHVASAKARGLNSNMGGLNNYLYYFGGSLGTTMEEYTPNPMYSLVSTLQERR